MRHKGSCQWIICPTSAFKCFTFHRRKTVDGSIIHSLESAVIEWSHQIRAVLKKDSSEALLEGKSPTPHTELLFWNNRSGPVLLQTLHVHWRPLSSTCSVSWLYENKNTSSEDLQSWIVVFKVFAVANYSSFRRNTCAIKRKMWFGAHCFLFVFCFFCRLQQNHTCWGQYPLLLSFVSSAHMWQRPVCFPSVLLFGHMQIWNVSTVIALDKFNLSLATVYLNYVLSGDLITFHH